MNYSNILDSTRQYFQGLPSAQQGDPGGGPVPQAPLSAPPAPQSTPPQQVFIPPQAKTDLRWLPNAASYPSTGAKLGSYPAGASRTPPYTPPSAGKASPYAAPPQQSKSPAVPASFYQQQQQQQPPLTKGLTSLAPSSSPSPAYNYKPLNQQFYPQFNSRGLPQVFETSKAQPVAVAKTAVNSSSVSTLPTTPSTSNTAAAATMANHHMARYPQINPMDRNSFAQQYQGYPPSKQHFYPGSYPSTSASAVAAAPPVNVSSAPTTPMYPTMTTPNSWMSSFGQQHRQQQQQQHHRHQQQQQQQLVRSSVVNHVNEQKSNSQSPHQHQPLQPPKAPPPPAQKQRPKRDSPLDLSVRTIRRSADSTHDDEAVVRLLGGSAAPEMGRADTTQPPRLNQPPPPSEQARIDLSLPSLLRSQDVLPTFRPQFRMPNYSSESEKAREAMAVSSLLSLEHKFGPQQAKQTVPPSQSPRHTSQSPQTPSHQQPPPQQNHIPHYQYQQQPTQAQLPQQQNLPNFHHFLPAKQMETLAQYNHHPPSNNHLQAQQMMYNHQQMNYQLYQQKASQSPQQPLSIPKHNHLAADKRVLSILRNSLETKNANQQRLLAEAAANQQQHPAIRMQGPIVALPPQLPSKQTVIKQQGDVPHTNKKPETPNLPQSGSDLDGLAALVAARIRTKAELKQHSGDFQQTQLLSPTSYCGRCSHHGCVCQKCRNCPEGVPCTCKRDKAAAPVSLRKVSDTRSSTETSVFDFPDSDPEISGPTSVGDMRRNRKAPTDTPPFSEPPPLSPIAKPEDVDPDWANVCSSLVTSLETKVSKCNRAAQHSFQAARKRKQQQEEKLKAKIIKLESQSKEELVESCINATSESDKLLVVGIPAIKSELKPAVVLSRLEDEEENSVLSDSSGDALPARIKKKIATPSSSSESDYEEELTLAERKLHRGAVRSSSSAESSESSTEESDWSDDVGKSVSGRLRTTRNGSRTYNTRKSKGGRKARGGKRKTRRGISSSEEEEEEDDDDVATDDDSSSPSPKPKRQTRRSAKQRCKSSSRSPSPEVRKTRSSKVMKPLSKKDAESTKPATKTAKEKPTKEVKEKENKSSKKCVKSIVEKPDKNINENSIDNGFYPGWETELVKFKQSLRMPSNLIRVHSRPNSDPPTPTKKRRGITDSPSSDSSLRGKKSDLDATKKKVIRDVELSDSSCSMPGRPKKKNEKVSQEVLKKLATKLKNKAATSVGPKRGVKSEEDKSEEESSPKKSSVPTRKGLRARRRSSRLSGNGERRHLRSAAQQRSNRILLNSKKHLRRRDIKVKEKTGDSPVKVRKTPAKSRRKLRSSGFDYLRKKKKKKEGSETSSTTAKKPASSANQNKSLEEIANEVRSWVVNKGLGETVLHRAARASRNDVAAYCLEALGMDPSAKDNAGYTPLHVACARGHLTMARLLLMYGALVDSSAQGGIRPLHEAAECGHLEVVRLLLSYGADPLLFNYAGQTSMDLGSLDAQKLLREHLDDIQGRSTVPWTFEFYNSLEPVENGFDIFDDAPIPEPVPLEEEEPEIEEITMSIGNSPFSLPATFWVKGETDTFMILSEVCSYTGHSQDWLKKTLKSEMVTKEMSKSQFFEEARCSHILGANWNPDPHKLKNNITLVTVDKELKRLLASAGQKLKR
ncbi:uncharacterized protein LOC132198191 isoform X2 [Neocloeon triangulifer]|uniref:uncharacterized protein LOC132198191 isoform X2 n=1 Tax=Neocloeon triangulifer TaxID=2078957 RepID=UPI00286EDE13|nr:uncharacterized protein LOC132198191 isoform X2 [Neocloeon triangulifer]